MRPARPAATSWCLAYRVTYNLPVTITRGSNNIGPFQYPEKVVPLFVTNALEGKHLPVYGDGRQMRDYQWVGDHCEAIDVVLHHGEPGEIYNVGTGQEMENLHMVEILLDELGASRSLIQHVEDRPGHDRRYSLNIGKVRGLGWAPRHDPEAAIRQTVRWYVANEWWWRPIKSGEFREYYERMYGSRKVLLKKLDFSKKSTFFLYGHHGLLSRLPHLELQGLGGQPIQRRRQTRGVSAPIRVGVQHGGREYNVLRRARREDGGALAVGRTRRLSLLLQAAAHHHA